HWRFQASDDHEDALDESPAGSPPGTARGESPRQIGMTGVQHAQAAPKPWQSLITHGDDAVARSIIRLEIPRHRALKEAQPRGVHLRFDVENPRADRRDCQSVVGERAPPVRERLLSRKARKSSMPSLF